MTNEDIYLPRLATPGQRWGASCADPHWSIADAARKLAIPL